MSDFLKSLAARQLGEAPAVRPRLSGRFEPPPDAFAHEASRRAAGFEEQETDALELSLEVETHAAHARDAATPRDTNEGPRTREPRRETNETHARVVFVREPREESQPVLRQERGSARDSEHAHDAPPPSNVTDSRMQTRERDEGDTPVRPRSIIPVPDEDDGLIRPDSQTGVRVPFVTRARAHDERGEPSELEPREPSAREAVEENRQSNAARPARPPSHARREADAAPRPRDEELSFLRNESARSRERERQREDADESNAVRQARRGRESSGTIEPRHVPRRERQAAARDAKRERAEAAPTINVTIGRVEVRATQAPAPAPKRTETAAPRMSLDDYLRRRRNGEVRE
ncbi:MAG TPA: hypothetical protein VGP08_16360 [Pyrinomonadaceae bacterium]|jgi:hypothetical protein|nr:hypothetical protein [Pyrinomonadaceae bacterium]